MRWYRVFKNIEEANQRVPQGSLELIRLGKRRICLAHTTAGYRAFSDTCTHLSASLSKGQLNYLDEVICPWHEYRFDTSNGAECAGRCSSLELYKIELREDGLFLGLQEGQ